MARRDLSDRYAGQVLGTIWAIVHPITIITVFLFIFGVVFRVKTANMGITLPSDQAVYMLSGLIPWLVAAEVLSRGPTMIAGQAALVKQVVFPIEVLPIKMVIATLPTLLIGFVGLIIYVVIRFHTVPLSYLLLPLASATLYVFLCGVAMFLSAIAIFVRDTKDMVQLYTLIGLYLAPIFYALDWVPGHIRHLLYLNPMTSFILMFHDAAYRGGMESPVAWAGAVAIALISLLGGTWLFSHLKPQFGSYV